MQHHKYLFHIWWIGVTVYMYARTPPNKDRHMELIICVIIGVLGAMIPYYREQDRQLHQGE